MDDVVKEVMSKLKSDKYSVRRTEGDHMITHHINIPPYYVLVHGERGWRIFSVEVRVNNVTLFEAVSADGGYFILPDDVVRTLSGVSALEFINVALAAVGAAYASGAI
ncbi:hypothetical protein Pisl_1415 [Pyrobaculum islandicum DSM 4184]|uniref:Uncharacterized protein n=1 Tax=Pyrobaculum islandicum (strain DSM 4184 / JCM 9189 / GEO3) TaxID=384616 RepID=A1RUE1_PYRIL|nr:hypothetical protein [Pyrobaculum islandicum]ABL88573.1 hypothetical protein Pisl_1415 [Pyrobaculum islandicum DSM 4184]